MTSWAAFTIARMRRASSRPSLWFTSAAARLMMASARITGTGMRSVPMRKFSSERCVCAPQ